MLSANVKGRRIALLIFAAVWGSRIACGAVGITISLENARRAYFRGEEIPLAVKVVNNSPEPVIDAVLSLSLAGVINTNNIVPKLEKDGSIACLFTVNSLPLKSGEYTAVCKLKKDDNLLAENKFTVWIARKWNPERMRVRLWPHHKFAGTLRDLIVNTNTKEIDEKAKTLLDWWIDKGINNTGAEGMTNKYNSSQSYGLCGLTKDYFKLFDYAIVKGLEMDVVPSGGFNISKEEGPARLKSRRKDEYVDDPFNAGTAQAQDKENIEIMKMVLDFPGVKTAFVNSEIEDSLNHFNTPDAVRLREEKLGPTTKHEFIAPGVIRDTDEKYVNALYGQKWGDGITTVNSRAARMVHQYRPDIDVFTDPYRRASVYDRFPDLDMVSTWTYTNPDPKIMLYIETLIAAAKPARQKVMHTATWLNYPGSIAVFTNDNGYVMMEPDRAVETSWINLSRRPDALCIYVSSGCDPFDENISLFRKSLDTYPAFKNFIDEVVKPYGPMIANLERTPRKTAVLSSLSSIVFNNGDPYWIYGFYILMNMAHLPADVIFDETITRYGLDDYDVLVLPTCEALTESVHKAILDFQKRGGLLISDQHLGATNIPDVVKFDFDFSFRGKVSANAIVKNKDYANMDDHLELRLAEKMKKVEGVTALADQELMESYAAKLRAGLKDKIKRAVDCSTPTALLNMLEKDGVKYLFVINDKRTYGERLGKWKAMLEKAVPHTTAITLNEWNHPKLFIYDLLEKKPLEYKKVSGVYQFNVDLPAPGGKIIAFYPEQFDKITILAPKEMAKGIKHKIEIKAVSPEGTLLPGVQPLQVEIKDPRGNISEFSDYYAAKNGFLSIDFIPALNDISGEWTIEVKDLAAGLSASASWQVL